MASEIEALPCIAKVQRSYSTKAGWRLATFQEAKDKLEMIKHQNLLEEWETARLLDGWIGGPRYNFQMGDDFRSCLGCMLIIPVQPAASSSSSSADPARSIYDDVPLTLKGRKVALLLCVEDWNYEVVYWLLSFWQKRERFNPLDVKEGNIPFNNARKFAEMNRIICDTCRILGEERVSSEKAMRRTFSRESVKEVMARMGESCWNKFSPEHKKIVGKKFLDRINVYNRYVSDGEECSKVNWFQEFASQGDISDSIWNFLWYNISSKTLSDMVNTSLSFLFNEWKNEGSQPGSRRDFIISSTILFHLSCYVHDSMERIFTQACKDAAGENRQRFTDTLKNTSFVSCDKIGNYDVFNKILIYAVRDEVSFVVNKVLEWGAQPQANLGPDQQNMALYYAILYNNKEIVRSLFDKCDSKEQFANAANEEGKTALHWACGAHGTNKESICRMILQEYGGRPDVPDNRGRLPLHYAVKRWNEGIVDVLIGEGNNDTVQSQDFNEGRAKMVAWKDKDGVSPLDIAVKHNNIKLMVKLLSVSQQALETYFDKVDSAKLLREFSSEGNIEVVKKLLESGADPVACDEQGQTALHHASMCQDAYKARKLTELMLEKCKSDEEKKNWVAKQDDMGKTALHVAAMKGNEDLCHYLKYNINLDMIQIRDKDGRTALFEAIEGGHYDAFVTLYHTPNDRSIVDRSGQTALHVAASEGRMRIADLLLRWSDNPKVYVRRPDVFGQTALHKAAKGGHADIIKVLLHSGAHPLLERDCDGRTVFHYFASTLLNGEDGKEVAELLLKKCVSDEKKLLLLWASAAGLGTADQHLSDCSVKKFLLQQKKDITERLKKAGKENNLLKTAACLGDIDLTKELLTRGAQIGDINDQIWRSTLSDKDKHNVDTVCQQIQSIAEQGNDQPTTSDNLGRSDFAHGLAALLLNPYLEPPITVGISGSWGMGKSSLMVQTEGILLKTAAQLALLPSEMPSSEISIFPGFQILEPTKKGREKYQQIDRSIDLLLNDKTRKEGQPLRKFLNKYEAKYHHMFKSLAAMDSSGLFQVEGQQSQSEIDPPTERSVPAILTVRYNAWKYRNESEALAGMAVEITKGMEGIMTDAQWLSTCLRNTWRKQKQVILIEIMFPCLLAVLLAASFTWILWLLLDRYKIKESLQLKYASFPLTVVIMAWALTKKVMSTVNPVSVQLMNYMKLPDHTEKLGYQDRVISDISFLKEEISKKPYCLCTAASYIWDFITGSCIFSLLSSKYSGKIMANSIPSANLRTIVFVDDLDRCQESIILQVLSAINLVLAVCKISVVLGMDKELIQRAIMRRHGDKSLKNSKLADKYLQKIIQLPLDLPDPSQEQSKDFLDRHLGVFQKQSTEGHSEPKTDAEGDSIPEIDTAYDALFSAFEQSAIYDVKYIAQKMLDSVTPISEANSSAETTVAPPQPQNTEGIAIDIQRVDGTSEGSGSAKTVDASPQTPPTEGIQGADGTNVIIRFYNILKSKLRYICNCRRSTKTQPAEGIQGADGTSELKIRTDLIPIRELLFVRYSEGERHAFCHFQKMVTDVRKLPREWKRLLTYHRLVWNIFIINNEIKHLDGWQVQLITWIFICWEFEENINILVQRWKGIDLLKTCPPWDVPSLRSIVEHCIKKESEKIATTADGRDIAKHSKDSENKDPPTQKLEDNIKENNATNSKNNMEQMKLKEGVNEQMTSVRDVNEGGDISESSEVAGQEKLITAVKEKNDELDKALLMKLDALEKEMQELKELVNSQLAGKSEKKAEGKKMKLQSWRRLKSALGKYDVSMAGIQAFQRFRFYCQPGHLPWPLPSQEEDNEDS